MLLRSLSRSKALPVPATTMEDADNNIIDRLNAQLDASKKEVNVLVSQHRHQSMMFAAEQKKQADQQAKSLENLERLQLLLGGVREQIKLSTRSVATLTVDLSNDDVTQPESGETTNGSGSSTPYLLSSQKSMDDQDDGLGLVKEEGANSVMIRGRMKSMETKLASIVEDISRTLTRQAAISRKLPFASEDGMEEHFYHAVVDKQGQGVATSSDGAMTHACASLEENVTNQIRQLHGLLSFEDMPLPDGNNQEDCGCYGFTPFSPRPGRNPSASVPTTSPPPEERIRAIEAKLVFALESVVHAAECRLSDEADERCELIAHQERVTLVCADAADEAKTTIQQLQQQLQEANRNIEALAGQLSPLQQVGVDGHEVPTTL